MDENVAVLAGMEYPASKQQIIDAATARGVPPEFTERLEGLPRDRYDSVDDVEWDLHQSRASSNPGLVAITPEVCEDCGFLKMPGEPHSCIEEKARFADSANTLTDEFEALDDSRES